MMHDHDHGDGSHVHLPTIDLKPGPVVWHKRCSRKHPRGEACDLVPIRRDVNGHYREHLHHPDNEKKKKPLRKKRVRKS